MFPDEIEALAKKVIGALALRKMMIVTAESCTGGLIAGALTAISGSSEAVHGGFVTYANEAKMAMIGVRAETLAQFGAVSEDTAREMAEGALAAAGVGISVAVTGIAGPSGGSSEKPVGLVHFGCATAAGTLHRRVEFGAIGREAVRLATVKVALELALEALESGGH